MAADQSYTWKFYEPNVQQFVEKKGTVFEPDPDAVTECLQTIRNNQGNMFTPLIQSMTKKILIYR